MARGVVCIRGREWKGLVERSGSVLFLLNYNSYLVYVRGVLLVLGVFGTHVRIEQRCLPSYDCCNAHRYSIPLTFGRCMLAVQTFIPRKLYNFPHILPHPLVQPDDPPIPNLLPLGILPAPKQHTLPIPHDIRAEKRPRSRMQLPGLCAA